MLYGGLPGGGGGGGYVEYRTTYNSRYLLPKVQSESGTMIEYQVPVHGTIPYGTTVARTSTGTYAPVRGTNEK